MRIFTVFLLLLLHITVSHGFYRVGTVKNGGVSGTIYLIDSNTLFLFEFTASESVNLIGANSGGSVMATTSGALSSAIMMIDAGGNLLQSDYITIRIASNNNYIASFPIPDNIYIPCSADYLGQFSKNGGETSHDLDGHVFLDRSARRFFVAGLDLDDSAPAAYFWLDTNASPSTGGKRAGYNGVYDARVNNVNNVDANVTVPPDLVDSTPLRSLSVWCEDFSVSFGHVDIPVVAADSFSCSTTFGPVSLGFTPANHQVSASVYVLGPSTIGFQGVSFDGAAPATWYWSGTTSTLSNGFIVPDQTGSLATLGALSNANVVVTLPAEYDVCNTNFISLYCVQASVNFGDVRFSSQFGCSGCPTRCRTNSSANTAFQCRDLSTTTKTRVEYRYDAINSLVTLRLLTCGQEADQYVAFGISGSDSGVSMAPNGDVVVCRYTPGGFPECIDYGLTSQSQCSVRSGTGSGACPDTELTNGVENYLNTAYERVGSRTVFTTTRAVSTSDPNDRPFTPGMPQYIIWARGATFPASGSQRWVLRHAPADRATSSTPTIDFSADSQCDAAFVCDAAPPVAVTPWRISPICINPDNNVIEAAIGNTGGSQGYEAITENVGWGIAWYLNGTLIPEVYVLRGTTVRIYVNGGDDPNDDSIYHPFYITNSANGGILGVIGGGMPVTETVYAGLDVTGNNVSNLTVGKYCNWDEIQGMSGNDFSTFEAYRDSLTLSCGANVTPRDVLEWTPDTNTPDLLYYQCATHKLLGWKIHVVDDLATCFSLQSAGNALSIPLALLLFMSLVVTVFCTI